MMHGCHTGESAATALSLSKGRRLEIDLELIVQYFVFQVCVAYCSLLPAGVQLVATSKAWVPQFLTGRYKNSIDVSIPYVNV